MTREALKVARIARLVEASLNRVLTPYERKSASPFVERDRGAWGWGPSDPGYALMGASRIGNPDALRAAYETALVTSPTNTWVMDSDNGFDGEATMADLIAVHKAYPEEGGALMQSVPLNGLLVFGAAYLHRSGRSLTLGAMERLRKESSGAVTYASGGMSYDWPNVRVEGSPRSGW